MKTDRPLVVFIVGPTASGKSDAAVLLAEKINAEIISADSMQVYWGMDILSAKPAEKLRERVPHYLIDILETFEGYSAALFREHALTLIKEIHSRNKIPLIVGGTGLYVRALTKGLFVDKGRDSVLREKLTEEAIVNGSEWLHNKLQAVDPKSAEKIHPNNLRRVIRALEAFEVNNTAISELQTQVDGLDKDYNLKIFGINRDRKELYQRIEQRVDAMFDAGLVEEVKSLRDVPLNRIAAQALGMKQIGAYLDGEATLEEAKTQLKRDTRRFAKRQLTWFRRQEPDIIWIEARKNDLPKDLAAKIHKYL
ncbi:MAG: tRNA (adenosine(37)-N6)-dimethylallyltransferase MiaA [PVC group bacterium]|nr:tRNA (adenosine(37)-N6)-dimethylallyltransferase MiaA [PVC group bacterium]